MSRKMSCVVGCGLLLVGATGCSDEIEPGDYVVYRIASAEQKLSSGCNLTANEIEDSTSLHASGTVILFAGQEGDYFLDTGELTLHGELLGDSDAGLDYQFEGESTDVEWTDPTGQGAKLTTSVRHRCDLTVDGELLTGETEVRYKYACSGDGCGNALPTCTVNMEFVGTEVEDVELEHNVN